MSDRVPDNNVVLDEIAEDAIGLHSLYKSSIYKSQSEDLFIPRPKKTSLSPSKVNDIWRTISVDEEAIEKDRKNEEDIRKSEEFIKIASRIVTYLQQHDKTLKSKDITDIVSFKYDLMKTIASLKKTQIKRYTLDELRDIEKKTKRKKIECYDIIKIEPRTFHVYDHTRSMSFPFANDEFANKNNFYYNVLLKNLQDYYSHFGYNINKDRQSNLDGNASTNLSSISSEIASEIAGTIPSTAHIPAAQFPSSAYQVPSSTYQVPSPATQIPSPATQVPSTSYQIPTPVNQMPSSATQLPTPAPQIPSPAAQIQYSPTINPYRYEMGESLYPGYQVPYTTYPPYPPPPPTMGYNPMNPYQYYPPGYCEDICYYADEDEYTPSLPIKKSTYYPENRTHHHYSSDNRKQKGKKTSQSFSFGQSDTTRLNHKFFSKSRESLHTDSQITTSSSYSSASSTDSIQNKSKIQKSPKYLSVSARTSSFDEGDDEGNFQKKSPRRRLSSKSMEGIQRTESDASKYYFLRKDKTKEKKKEKEKVNGKEKDKTPQKKSNKLNNNSKKKEIVKQKSKENKNPKEKEEEKHIEYTYGLIIEFPE